jgi:hypothetical protein
VSVDSSSNINIDTVDDISSSSNTSTGTVDDISSSSNISIDTVSVDSSSNISIGTEDDVASSSDISTGTEDDVYNEDNDGVNNEKGRHQEDMMMDQMHAIDTVPLSYLTVAGSDDIPREDETNERGQVRVTDEKCTCLIS